MYLELRIESRPLPRRRRILIQRTGVVSDTDTSPRWSLDLWVDALSVDDVPERRALQLADGSVTHKSYFDVENGAFVAPGPPVIGWRWKHGSLGITDGYLPSIFPELTATPNGNGINTTYQLTYQLTDGFYSFPAPTRFAVLHETSSPPLLLYLQLGSSLHPANMAAILLQRVEGESVWIVARLAADSPEVRSGQRHLVFRDATSRETWVRVAAGGLLAPLLEASGVELVSVENRRHLGKGSFATNDTELVRHWGVSFLGVRHLTLVDSVVENVPLSPYGALLECRSCGEVALRNVTVRHLSPPAPPATAPGSGGGDGGGGSGRNTHYWRGAIALHNVTSAELDGFTCAHVTGAYNWACVLLDVEKVPGPDALRLVVSRSVLSHNAATSPPPELWRRSAWFNSAAAAQPGCALAAVRGVMSENQGVLSVRMTDCDITNNTADSGPAFVTDFEFADSVVISRSNISHNTAAAGHGGALHFGEGSVGELRLTERTAIDHNKASLDGGAVYLSRMFDMVLDGGSSLSYNTAAGRGGALLCNNFFARLTLLGSSAADGNTAGADGGFGMWDETIRPWFLFGTNSNSDDELRELSGRNGTTILVAGNSSISGNAAGGDGGAVRAYRILALHVTDGGRVDGNVANGGGSVLSVATLLYANITGRGSSMSGNRAAGGAAALAVSEYLVHELRVQDGGRADSNWAAVPPALLSCPVAGRIIVRGGGSVSNNTAEAPADGQGGGAVHVMNADSVLIAEGGTFSHNAVKGANGGALFVAERLQQLTITGCGSIAAGNAAPGGYGGFLAAGSLGVLDVSDGGALANNTARDNGGAVAVSGFIQTITIRGARTSVSGNTAQVGGVIFVTQDVGDVFVQDGASVEANLATARTGGFLSVGRVVQGTVRVAGGSRVCRCAAALSGGAVFIQESVFGGVVVSDNATMCHNRAEGGPGGAVYSGFSIDSVLVARGGALEGNTAAAGPGGAVGAAGLISTVLVARGGALEGNTAAAGPGGAVGAAGLISNVSLVDGGRVTGNTASGNGGAFYADFIGSLNVSGRAFAASNRAGGDGGLAFASRLTSLSVADGSEVAANRAGRSGGAVAVLTPPDAVALEGSLLHGNVAEQGTGGVLSVAIPQAGSPLLSQVAPAGVVSVTLSDAEFIGNGAYLDGGALGFAGEAPSDPTGALSNLRAIALRIAVRGCNFSSNYAGGAGGALAVSSPAAGITTSEIQVYDSRFYANVAGNQQFRLGSSASSGYGGAVFVLSSSKLRAAAILSGARGAATAAATEDEDSGYGGSGSEGGGGDGAEDGEEDYGGDRGDGGNGRRRSGRRRLAAAAAAVVSLDSSCALRLRRVRFEDNRCQGSGGAVAALLCPTLIADSTFEGNEARFSGGAVASIMESVAVEEAAAAAPPPAAGGGAAALRRLQRQRQLRQGRARRRRLLQQGETSVAGDGGEGDMEAPWFEVANSNFEGNRALLECGGGLYTEVAVGAESLVVGSVFEGNEAEASSGGAVCLTARGDGAAAAIGGGSRLRDNTASRGGGGVYLDLSGGVGNVVELEGMRLRGNEAAEGGAVAVMAAAGSAAVLHGVTMESNAATADGGGLHILCAGAACGSEPLATLQRCNITANVAGGDTGGAGVVGRGGGLFVGAGGVARMEDCTLRCNITANVAGGDTGGAGVVGRGGGLFVGAGGVARMEDCTLVRNAAAAAGGGVAAVGCGALELLGGVVAGGAAGLQGGGVYTEGCGSVLLRGAVLEGNRAATGGGAFFADAAVAAPAAASARRSLAAEAAGVAQPPSVFLLGSRVAGNVANATGTATSSGGVGGGAATAVRFGGHGGGVYASGNVWVAVADTDLAAGNAALVGSAVASSQTCADPKAGAPAFDLLAAQAGALAAGSSGGLAGQLSRACALLSMLAPCTPDDDRAEVAAVAAAATGPRVGALIDVAPTHMRLEAFPEQLRPGTAFSISVRLYNGLNQPIQRDTLPFTVTLSMAPAERPASLDSRSGNATLPPPNGTSAPRPWRDASVAYLDPGGAAGGSLSVPVVGGLATWPFLTVRGWPGRYVVAFDAASAADPGLYQIEPLRVEVDLGRCQPGEALDLTWTQQPGSQPSWLSCSRCSRGRFTLWRDQRPSLWELDREDYMAAIRNASVAAAEAEATCLPCPDRSSCLGGAVLVPVPGAWHSGLDSALFHRCPKEEACGRGADGDAWSIMPGVSPADLQVESRAGAVVLTVPNSGGSAPGNSTTAGLSDLTTDPGVGLASSVATAQASASSALAGLDARSGWLALCQQIGHLSSGLTTYGNASASAAAPLPGATDDNVATENGASGEEQNGAAVMLRLEELRAGCAAWSQPPSPRGGGARGAYSQLQCAPGYTSHLCAACTPGYFINTEFECRSCPTLGLNAALAVLTFLGGVALVLYTSYTNLQDSYAAAEEEDRAGEEPASEFLKVAILHAQFYVIITRLPVAYPDVINRLQAFVSAATGAESTVAFAYSCFLPGLDSGGQARVQQLGALLVPAAVVAASVALWGASRAAAAAAAVAAAAMAAVADGDGKADSKAGFDDLDEKPESATLQEEEEGEKEQEQEEEERQAEEEQEDSGVSRRGSGDGDSRWLIRASLGETLVRVDESMVIYKQLGFVFVVALSILYPGWAQAALSVFSCYQIDDGHSGPFPDRQQATWRYGYWVRDMAQECYRGTHLALYMPVGVAAVALVCLMPPLTSFVLLYSHRNELDDPAVRQRYGFLYMRYKPRFYWWESVLMLEELVLVAVEVFGRTLAAVSHQILLMLVVFIVLSLVNMACAPTKSRLIGLLEFLSLGVLSLTVTCSLYFVVGEPLSPEAALDRTSATTAE
ncbi:hypothetical protein GPECTOR_25g370 [Gonium pectorale]|uniref:Right handed beta helix domain-containing protein n=1 Tax=Gonium pectorale TaxID=33097 RepID=A0A150GG30_GONPE|nr:hypothetical protein GPECTOR_25g370 [Gonium pectorale]|eukprot:KXZ48786.1 hypothetical protein GPECTOR_25g370 [Gonium pectorale]